MVNITNFLQTFVIIWGGGTLINKGFPLNNFIYLITLLSLWLLTYILVINKSVGHFKRSLFVILTATVLLTLKTKSLMIFFVFFELRVIPITLIIFLFGYQPEKLQAAIALLLYTVVSSLPLLLFVLYCELSFISAVLSLPITLRFIVKTPMYILHTWLPKAHVEAPIGGSIVLAGVLLKLGSYGLLIFLPFVKLNVLLIFYLSISLLGSAVCSIICFRSGDLKLLIAYSSVVHIGVVTLGFISGREIGLTCGLIIVIGHGLSSPFLFAHAYWIYTCSLSRLIINNSSPNPLLMVRIFGLVTLNIGVPPRLNVWAEVFLSNSLLSFMRSSLPLFITILFLGGAYNFFLYTSCIHGKFPMYFKSIEPMHQFSIYQVVFYGYSAFFCLDFFHVYFYYYD